MKVASRIFTIFGLIGSIFVLLLGITLYFGVSMQVLDSVVSRFPDAVMGFGLYYFIYGCYGIFWSILSLISTGCHSKGFVVFCGIFYLPVSLLASIFMFCIKSEDLY